MTSETLEFANGANELEAAQELRKHPGQLRGGGGYVTPAISYGLGAYGSPIGAVSGVQSPSAAVPPEGGEVPGTTPGGAMSADQFGDGASLAGGGSGMGMGMSSGMGGAGL